MTHHIGHVTSLACIAAIALASCTSDPTDDAAPGDSTIAAPTVVQTAARPAPNLDSIVAASPKLDACELARHVSQSLDSIARWPLSVFRGQDDNCVLAILDSLSLGFVATRDPAFLEALDSIAAYADGYVSEALWDVTDTSFGRRPREFVAYLQRQRTSPLESFLISSWNSQFSESSDSAAIKGRLLADIRGRIPLDSLTADERGYVESIFRRARLID